MALVLLKNVHDLAQFDSSDSPLISSVLSPWILNILMATMNFPHRHSLNFFHYLLQLIFKSNRTDKSGLYSSVFVHFLQCVSTFLVALPPTALSAVLTDPVWGKILDLPSPERNNPGSSEGWGKQSIIFHLPIS